MSRWIGGGIEDYVVTRDTDGSLVLAANATVTFWDAVTAGNQHTDFTDATGAVVESVNSDNLGAIPQTFIPDDVPGAWADANGGAGPRRWMDAHSVADEVTTLTQTQAGISADRDFLLGSAVLAVERRSDGSWPTRPSTGRRVLWADRADLVAARPDSGAPFAQELDYYLGP